MSDMEGERERTSERYGRRERERERGERVSDMVRERENK